MTKGALLILVNDKNEVLLQHKDGGAPTYPNKWCLFGGGVENNESTKQTIHREFVEELEWKLGDIKHFAQYADNDVFYFKTNRKTDNLRKKLHEGSDLGYFSEQEIMSMDIAKPHLKILKDYFTGRKPTTVHFICRGNALRSIIAEAYLNSLGLDGVIALSSGTFATENIAANKERQQQTRNILKKYGFLQYAKKDFAEQLTDERFAQADLTVCVNKHVFDGYTPAYDLPAKTIFWNIADIGDPGRSPNTNQELQAFEEEIFTEIIQAVDALAADQLQL